MTITIELDKKDIDKLNRTLQRFSIQDKEKLMKAAFDDAVLSIEGQLKRNVTGRYLNVRSGRLRSSEESIVVEHNDELLGLVGSGARNGDRVAYDRIQEEGGTIRPKRAKYLTIPFKAALTAAGAMKFPSARDYPNTFVARKIIWQKVGKKIVPLFALVKRAVIPPHRYMAGTAREMQEKVLTIMLKTIKRIAGETA